MVKFTKTSLFNFCVFCLLAFSGTSQNPNIKCYFNHAVNTAASSGVNAVYLNGTFADTVAACIDRAKLTVDVAIYDFTSTSTSHVAMLATAINNAFARGVQIRWIYDGSSTNSGLSLVNASINRLASPTTSAYGIMHNKFIAIDANSSTAADAVLITGSYNWSDQQSTGDYNNLMIIEDQGVAQAYSAQFNQMWGGTGAAPNSTNSKFGVYKSPSASTTFTVNGTTVEVYFSPMDNSQTHLKNSILTANNDLHFGIYTFTDNTLATAIKNKYTAGITGFGIMDQFCTTYSPYSTLSSAMGSNLKVYSSNSYLYHNKILLVDALHPSSDPQVCTGSFNWSASAENMNDENLIIVHDAVIANQYYQSLCKNFVNVGGTACPAYNGIESYDYGALLCAVYPNPFTSKITVDVKQGSERLEIKIFDAIGNVVLHENASAVNRFEIDSDNLAEGVYVVQVFDGKDFFTQKIIK